MNAWMMQSINWLGVTFMPLVTCYHLISSNVFLNTAANDATGLEKFANTILIPFQYLFAGELASPSFFHESFRYELSQRFDYHHKFGVKTIAAAVALPVSVTLGSALKGLSYLSPEVQARHIQITQSFSPLHITSNLPLYKKLGMTALENSSPDRIATLGFVRKAGDENNLRFEKEALREIVSLLKTYQIPFWADCGTCLGAYRYGGSIPWDDDIDIAVLQPDFRNIKSALKELDHSKYLVEDWSNRFYPETYLKVYIRKTGAYIDIYHFAIHPETKSVQYILSNNESFFMSADWKKSQQCFRVETPFDVIFPLKMASFDGIDLPVPNQTKKYLQMRYGEDLSPVRIFNPQTASYEKDLSHPYWKEANFK